MHNTQAGRPLWAAVVAMVLLVTSVGTAVHAEGLLGELDLAAGGKFPQGSFTDWADHGVSLRARTDLRPFKAREFSGWVDVDFTHFSTHDEPVVAIVDDTLVFPAEQTTSQWAGSLHAGIQLGSGTRRGFFRPRAAIAPGMYFYNTSTTVRLLDTEDPFLTDELLQIRLGWRAVAGTDLYFVSQWGISLNFAYEAVWNLHQTSASDAQG